MSLGQALGEFRPPSPLFTETDVPDLSNKVYLITGGTSGIGLALAKILYSKNARVYITSRTPASAENAINETKKEIPISHGQIAYLTLDLTDLSTIAPAVKDFLAKESRLHSVWYNAGVMNTPAGSRTRQGYEIQWGTNVVAHFVINKLLMPILLSTAQVAQKGSVRSVWVSSDGHVYYSPKPDGIDWNDITTKKPDGWKGDMSAMKYYGQSKAGDVILSKEAAARYGEQGVVSVSLNPGHLKSNLQRHRSAIQAKIVDYLFLYDPRYGALTELYAGFSEDIGLGNNGAYVIPWGRIGMTRADIDAGLHERGSGAKLWDILEAETESYTG